MPTFLSQIIQQHSDAGYWHQQYPWFSIGQLVDAFNKKDTPAFVESAQQAAVFFSDIPRLHWLLHQQEAPIAALQALLHPETELQDVHSAIETGIEAAETHLTSTDIVHTADNSYPPGNMLVQEKLTVAETDNKKVTKPAEPSPFLTANETPPNPIAETVPELWIKDPRLEPQVANSHLPHLNADTTGSEPSIAEPEDKEDEPDRMPLPVSMLSESLAKAADSYKNNSPDEDTLVFKTAYQHTIDYFASQGIRLDGEPAKDDRFGQQLKTFTSWLRQMKRLPDALVPEADPLVESHAAHSLQKGEVVTESMADVLVKQGKTSQAIAVLEKLRLLHPQKSHYFAARIDQLKHT